jgi:hypothetical protein
MNRLWLIRIAIIVIALLLVAAAIFSVKIGLRSPSYTRVTVEDVRVDVQQHIPDGSTRDDVVRYLDRRHIEHSYNAAFDRDGKFCRTETAIIRDTAASGFITTSIQLYFNFDEAMKLTSYEVRKMYTGP